MNPVELDTGPPARKKEPLPPVRREGAKATGLPLKSSLPPHLAPRKTISRRLRIACAALSVDELSRWGACRHVTFRRRSTCP